MAKLQARESWHDSTPNEPYLLVQYNDGHGHAKQPPHAWRIKT